MLSNQSNVPLPMAIWLASDEYSYAKDVNEISTTTLMRSPRYIMATRRMMFPELFPEELRLTPTQVEVFSQDIQERIPARVGTAIHTAIDFAINIKAHSALKSLGYPESMLSKLLINPEPDKIQKDSFVIMTEQRSYKEIDKFVISGQYDAVVNGVVHDIKTTSTFAYTSGSMDKKYIIQGSIYRWLNPDLITEDEIVINFLFTDWNKNYVYSRENYPPTKVLGKSFKLWSVEETEMYIRDKLNQLKKYWNDPLHLIPCCTDEDLYSGSIIYKYYKSGYEEGKRSTKNFDSLSEATLYRAKNKGVGEIIVDKGKPFKCPCCDIGIPNYFNTGSINETKLEIE